MSKGIWDKVKALVASCFSLLGCLPFSKIQSARSVSVPVSAAKYPFITLKDPVSALKDPVSALKDPVSTSPAATNTSASDLGDVFLQDAVTAGLIEERRRKYLGANSEWKTDTFRGAFRISPPDNLVKNMKSSEMHGDNFKNMKTFEYFLWADAEPQPTFEVLKKLIAKAIHVKTGFFYFTVPQSGQQLFAKDIMLDELEALNANDFIGPEDNQRKVVDIVIQEVAWGWNVVR